MPSRSPRACSRPTTSSRASARRDRPVARRVREAVRGTHEQRPQARHASGGKSVSQIRKTGTFGGAAGYFQFVSADGKTRLPATEHVHLPAGQARAVAAGKHKSFYSEATVGGVHLRVYTVRINGNTALKSRAR